MAKNHSSIIRKPPVHDVTEDISVNSSGFPELESIRSRSFVPDLPGLAEKSHRGLEGYLSKSSTHFSWNVSRDSRYGWYPKQEKSTFRGKIARCLRRVVARR
jgi:hypothetical protein